MRNNLCVLLVSALLTACSGGADYLIKGSSKEFADGSKVYLFYLDTNDEPVFIDSTVCEKNSFAFSGVADTLKMAAVVVAKSPVDGNAVHVDLVLEPGKISIGESDAEKRHIDVATGTPLNDVLDRFSREVGAYINNPDSLFPFIASYIRENIDNPVGGYLFDRYHFSMPCDMKLELINSMSERQRAGYAAISEETLMRIEQEKARAAKARELFPGNLYKDFTAKSTSGEDVSLKSVVENGSNSYILLLFWATWCAPCRADMPKIADLYEQYRDKGFEVFAASIDDDRSAWLGAVKDYSKWQNVLVDGAVHDLYGVRGVPAHFLIDCPTGKIVVADTWTHRTLNWRDEIVKLFEADRK